MNYVRRMKTKYIASLLIVLAVLASACSESDDTEAVASLEGTETEAPADGAEPASSNEEEAEAALLDFTQCMRAQGIEIGDPTMDANGNLQMPPIELETSSEDDMGAAMTEMDAAFAECDQHLQGAVMGSPDPGADAEFEDAFIEYAGCMRDHGIDMPDPDFSADGGMMIDLGGGTPGDQDEFDAAHKECQPILAGIGIDL